MMTMIKSTIAAISSIVVSIFIERVARIRPKLEGQIITPFLLFLVLFNHKIH